MTKHPQPTARSGDGAQHAEVDRLTARVAELEKENGELMSERDDLHDRLDELASVVAPPEVIGEHSSHNDPWQRAQDLITPAAHVDLLQAESNRYRTAWLSARRQRGRRRTQPTSLQGRQESCSHNEEALRAAGWAPRDEVLREARDAVIAWLTKKSGEAQGMPDREAAHLLSRLASKVWRGAIRAFPNDSQEKKP